MAFCSPKCSLCGLLLSVWGIIQLVIMGIFYYVRSVALIEDLGIHGHHDKISDFYNDVDKAYLQNAYNCWIAACIYVFTLCLSGHQFYMNTRTSVM